MAGDSTANIPNVPFPNIARDQSFIRQQPLGPIENFLDFFDRRSNGSCLEFVAPDTHYDVGGLGEVTMQNRSIQYLYETLCNFCTATPQSAQWVVFIEPHNSGYLLPQIGNMKGYEPHGSSLDFDFSDSANYLMRDDYQRRIGCIFAIGASEAGVSIGTAQEGGINGAIAGFQKAPVTQGRADNELLELVFRETNCSYIDFVLRPWVSLVGHKGLHARPAAEDIKADITIFEMTGTFSGQLPIVRKIFKYYDAAPVNVPSVPLDYEQQKLIQRNASFVYSYFTVQDGTGYGFNNEAERRREFDGAGVQTVGDNVYGVVDDAK